MDNTTDFSRAVKPEGSEICGEVRDEALHSSWLHGGPVCWKRKMLRELFRSPAVIGGLLAAGSLFLSSCAGKSPASARKLGSLEEVPARYKSEKAIVAEAAHNRWRIGIGCKVSGIRNSQIWWRRLSIATRICRRRRQGSRFPKPAPGLRERICIPRPAGYLRGKVQTQLYRLSFWGGSPARGGRAGTGHHTLQPEQRVWSAPL